MIRFRCMECKRIGAKYQYAVHFAREAQCRHKERRFQAIAVRADGSQAPKTCLTFEDAGDWLTKTHTELNEGTHKRIEAKKFKEIAESYLLSFLGNVKPCSYTDTRYYIYRLIEKFGEYPIHKVTVQMLNKEMALIAHQSFSKRKTLLRHIKGIFKLAQAQGAIKENPASFMTGVRKVKKIMRYQTLKYGRIHELLDDTKEAMIKLYYKVAFYLGLRPNEICGLSKDAVDLNKREIKIFQTLYYFKTVEERNGHQEPFIIQDCKSTASYRVVPIGKELYADIQIHLINAPENKHNLLFAWPNGKPINHATEIIKDRYNPQIKSLNKRTGFPIMIFYKMTRHTYASMLFEMGINLKKVQYLMGHEEFETTANIYAKIFGKNISEDNEFRAVGDRVEEFLNQGRLSE